MLFCPSPTLFFFALSLQIAHLQSVCDKKSVCVRELQRNQECVLSRLEESVRRREEEWSRQHTHTVRGLQSELQVTHTHTLIPGVFQRLVYVSHVALQRQRHCELNQQDGSRKISVISPFGQILRRDETTDTKIICSLPTLLSPKA